MVAESTPAYSERGCERLFQEANLGGDDTNPLTISHGNFHHLAQLCFSRKIMVNGYQGVGMGDVFSSCLNAGMKPEDVREGITKVQSVVRGRSARREVQLEKQERDLAIATISRFFESAGGLRQLQREESSKKFNARRKFKSAGQNILLQIRNKGMLRS
jgi:hypothetical protein